MYAPYNPSSKVENLQSCNMSSSVMVADDRRTALNTALLYLSTAKGGLSDLPALSSLYKHLQVSRQCQVLTSPDPYVRHIAEKHLAKEMEQERKIFKPCVFV